MAHSHISPAIAPGFVHLPQAPRPWAPPTLRLLVGTRLRVFWPLDSTWYTGVVTASLGDRHRILYDDGDTEDLDLAEERYELLPVDSSGSSTPLWARNIEEYWLSRLGDSPASRTVIAVMQSALADNTRGNYHPKVLEYLEVCASAVPPLIPVPADANTIMHYLGYLKSKGTISSSSVQVYLSAVNKLHTESGHPAPAVGTEARDFIRGMGRIQKRELVASGVLADVRAPLPTHVVTEALDRAVELGADCADLSRQSACLFRSCAFVALNFVLICRGDTGVSLPPHHLILDNEGIHVVPLKEKGEEHRPGLRLVTIPRDGVPGLYDMLVAYKAWHAKLNFGASRRPKSLWRLPHEMQGKWPSSKADDFLQDVLLRLGHSPPAGLSYSGHSMRKGSSSAAKAIGCLLEAICYFAGWSILAGTFHRYIDPTWTPTVHCWRLFGWMRPPDRPPAHV